MVTVSYYEEYDQLTLETKYGIKSVGHANYDEVGKDIVCASVSALTQAFIYFTMDLAEDNMVEIIHSQIEDGNISYCVKGRSEYIGPAFNMLKTGIGSIEYTYPEYVKTE